MTIVLSSVDILITFHMHTHTRLTALFPGLPRWEYQRGKTNLDFAEARDSEWQWHQLGHLQVCTSLQTDNHASTPTTQFFTGRMPLLPPNQQCQCTEGKALKAVHYISYAVSSKLYRTDRLYSHVTVPNYFWRSVMVDFWEKPQFWLSG